MKHWGQNPLNSPQQGAVFVLSVGPQGKRITWQDSLTSARVTHTILTNLPYESIEASANLKARALCYRLLDLMPDVGLKETLSTLADYYEYYATLPQSLPSLPQPVEAKTQFGGYLERPPLVINEE